MDGRGQERLLIFMGILAISLCIAFSVTSSSDAAQTIVDEWSTVKAPPAPELKQATIDPKVTALLVLDIQKQTCSPRPRCIASLPNIQTLLKQARARGMLVAYSIIPGSASTDILSEVAPLGGEPIVTSGPDKFLGTDLEKILKEKGVTTVIVVGTAAHGVVLHTGSGAALRGFKAIVPVDGMSADNPYPEQYTAWHLVNAPRISAQSTLTRTDMIQFQ